MNRRVSRTTLLFVAAAAFALYAPGALTRRGPAEVRARTLCDYRGPAGSGSRVYRFGSVAEATAAVDRILKVVGLTRNFVIEASSDVENAESGIDGNNRRYIYYNPAFMERIKNKARTDWAAVSILAHEIGHHLLGHRTEDGGRTPQEEEETRHRQELEADRYSGFNLRYMGASVREAQSAVEAYGDGEDGSPTHPPMRARWDAVRDGWDEADGIVKALAAAEGGQTARLPPRPAGDAPATRRTPAAPEAPRARTARGVPRISAHNTSTRLSEGGWQWTVFIDAPPEVLEQVSCVVYQLHPTFRPSAVQVCERGEGGEAFALTAVGWGTFEIQIRVLMKDRTEYALAHALRF